MNSQPDIGKTDPYAELPALTGLRGFAALWVLLYHVWAMSGAPALRMPGVDGLEMLRALKRNAQLADMQIVVISGLPAAAIKARGGLPLHAHLHGKPVNFDWLQGFMTAMVAANVKWRRREPIAARSEQAATLEPALLAAQYKVGVEDDGR